MIFGVVGPRKKRVPEVCRGTRQGAGVGAGRDCWDIPVRLREQSEREKGIELDILVGEGEAAHRRKITRHLYRHAKGTRDTY